MTFEQFKVLVKGMKAVYTSPNFLPDADSVKIWYELLKDIPYELANIAIQRHMSTNKFPPTVAEIREWAVKSVTEPTDWASGWEQVRKAISKYGMYRAQEAYNSMDEITQTVVKRLGWKNICESENYMQDRANFRMAYEQEQARQKETAVLTAELNRQINRLQGSAIKAIGGRNEQDMRIGDKSRE